MPDDAQVAYFGAEAGGVLCEHCGAGGRVRLTVRDVLYLQAIMRRGLDTLQEEASCPDGLFAALRMMAEDRLGVPIRSGKDVIIGKIESYTLDFEIEFSDRA